jgi:DNA-binding transcriptional LysR family regulator
MAADDLQERLPRHLKLRELRVLLAVAEQGSFRKAAQVLHLTQPAVTAAIAELKGTLRVTLFDRTTRGVTATAHGESFIRRASAIFGELRLAAEDIEIISGGSRGTLRVGTVPVGGVGVLPVALHRLLHPHADVFVLIREADEDVLIELLKSREIDIVFSRLPLASDPGLAYRLLFEDSICVFASRTHYLAARKRVTWDELANELWVAPPPGTRLFDHVQRTLHKGGLAMPRHVIQTMSLPMAFSMLLQGDYLCFGTYLHYEFTVHKPMLTILKIDLPQVMAAFGVITLPDRELNPLGLRLVKLVEDLAQAARRRRGPDNSHALAAHSPRHREAHEPSADARESGRMLSRGLRSR